MSDESEEAESVESVHTALDEEKEARSDTDAAAEVTKAEPGELQIKEEKDLDLRMAARAADMEYAHQQGDEEKSAAASASTTEPLANE